MSDKNKKPSLVRDWISYPWRIDNVTRHLSSCSSIIHSPSFPGGVDRRWQLSLVIKQDIGTPLEALPLYLTVIDTTSVVVKAAVKFTVLCGSGWTTVGSGDKRIMIDIGENKMGSALVEDRFLTLDELRSFVNTKNDSVTIRCQIHVFEDDEPDGAMSEPRRSEPPFPFNTRRSLEDDSDDDDVSNPNKRRHIQ